jgi:hypothetical protein
MSQAAAPLQIEPDTFGHAEVSHPYSAYKLSEAVKMARGFDEEVNSLVEARTLITDTARKCGFTWITGAVALDVLDAAIDGRDLLKDCRIMESEKTTSAPAVETPQ